MDRSIPLGACALLSLMIAAHAARAESLTVSGLSYHQNFNDGALATSGSSSSVLPSGWTFAEPSGNRVYSVGTGSSSIGDTYSYGATNSTDRAFGSLRSGSVVSTIGATFTNNIGSAITSLLIEYMGEQWRLGALGREDRLDFQYSLSASSLISGTWIDVDALDFIAPTQAGTLGQLDGNSNRSAVSGTIVDLNIAAGATFWLRWRDFDSTTSSEDGLAVDDFSLTPNPTVVPVPLAFVGGAALFPLVLLARGRRR